MSEQLSRRAKIRDLGEVARNIRIEILEEISRAGKGHIGPSFSWVEIGVALFFWPVLNLREKGFADPNRDRFILSKGHGCQTLYSILRIMGQLPVVTNQISDSKPMVMPGHPDVEIPGVEANTGSLGHGLGIGLGMALAARMTKRDYRTFVLIGDGELGEGSVWEAIMLAGHLGLSNLTAIIDRNGLGATAPTEKMLTLEPLATRLEAFGWYVSTVDGHSIEEVAYCCAKEQQGRPTAIIANTVKGKGVSFMEGTVAWHHKVPSQDEVDLARKLLLGGD